MSLSRILSEIKKITPVANEDVDSGNIDTLTARRGRKRNAQETLKRLHEQYAQETMRNSEFVIVDGAQDYVDPSAFVVDPEGFYRELAGRVAPALYNGKEGNSSLFDTLGRHLEDQALEMGILGYPQLIFKQEYRRVISTQEEFVQLIKQAINDQVGAEMVGIHAVRSIVDRAIKEEHVGPTTKIFLPTTDKKLVSDLSSALKRLTPKVSVVNFAPSERTTLPETAKQPLNRKNKNKPETNVDTKEN